MLDPQGRKEVLKVAAELKEQGMTVILITHFMEEVATCDKVVVMSGGHVLKQGAPMEIFEDYELLNKVGLEAPRSIALAQKLKQAGFNVTVENADAKTLGGEVCLSLTK